MRMLPHGCNGKPNEGSAVVFVRVSSRTRPSSALQSTTATYVTLSALLRRRHDSGGRACCRSSPGRESRADGAARRVLRAGARPVSLRPPVRRVSLRPASVCRASVCRGRDGWEAPARVRESTAESRHPASATVRTTVSASRMTSRRVMALVSRSGADCRLSIHMGVPPSRDCRSKTRSAPKCAVSRPGARLLGQR